MRLASSLLTCLLAGAIMAQPIFAQTSINGVPLSADEIQRVDGRCAELVNAGGALGAVPSFNSTDREADELLSDRMTGLAGNSDGAMTRIDLRSITLEACFAAGFLDRPGGRLVR